MRAELGRAELYELFDGDPEPVMGFLRWLVEVCGLGATPRVLEIGCGPGRLLVAFAGLGWDVEGLEPDAAYVERAVERARGLDGVRVRRGGFADVDAEAAFEVVAAMNGPFSYLLTPEAREDAARRMHGALVPGGGPSTRSTSTTVSGPTPTAFASRTGKAGWKRSRWCTAWP